MASNAFREYVLSLLDRSLPFDANEFVKDVSVPVAKVIDALDDLIKQGHARESGAGFFRV